MPNKVPYLCGGIFFGLLLQARKNRTKARDKQKGGSDGLSDADVMKGLVYVVTGESVKVSGKTFAKATSMYKSCQISDNTYIPFKDVATITAFDDAVRNKKIDILNRMSEFIGIYLNENKKEWLVKALLDTIAQDQTINDDDVFFIHNTDGITKKDLLNHYFIDYSAFLLAVFHFILTQHADNSMGRATFESWYTQENERAEWKFDSTIGSNIKADIKFMSFYGSNVSPFFAGSIRNGKTKLFDHLSGAAHVGNFTSLVGDMLKGEEAPFSKYLERAKDFYSKTKTLLYSEKPREFYDFYVCNTLRVAQTRRNSKAQYIGGEAHLSDVTISKLEGLTNYAIISGTGGIGKSMMMRHLLLTAISTYESTGKLPILISLKNYSSDCDLRAFIYQSVKAIDYSVIPDQVYDLLENGNCIILLDGLDEILSSLRDKFETELEHLTIRYPENMFVISSRPTTQFLSYKRFTVFEIDEFTKEQSLELVDRLDFYDVEAKTKFRDDLDKRLFKSHKQFASNPLLLTIMLMTYSSIGDIPGKMHIFYAKAFETMARLHDATKGAYKRPLHTGLEPEEFAKYFAEFCARTYRAEELEFTAKTFSEYMEKVIKHRGEELKCSTRDFLLDLKDNLCIMYEEGEKYYFVHRSFQEYFSAVFFSEQMDDKLAMIADQFKELRQKSYHDKTFDMLYDMIPQKIDRFVFAPYLKELWNRCDSGNGYWTFLTLMYPTIFSYSGDSEEWYENTPEEYFYDFIVNENLIRENGQLDDLEWPLCAERFKKVYATMWTEVSEAGSTKQQARAVDVESFEFSEYCSARGNDYEPDYCGESWEIEIAEVLKDQDKYQKLIEFIENDEFPLKKEYNAMRAYSNKLFARFEKSNNTSDWFDNL